MSSEFDMTAVKGGSGKSQPPAGNHEAILVGIFSMGMQENEFQGEVTRNRRAFFVWELVSEQIAGTTKNHVIGIDLTLSMNEKAKLRRWIEARTGKKIADGTVFTKDTLTQELGKSCLLSVVTNDKGYPKVDSVAALPKGITPQKASYPLTLTSLADFQASPDVIPEWCPWLYGNPLADHIRASVEMGGGKPRPKAKSEATAQPVPF